MGYMYTTIDYSIVESNIMGLHNQISPNYQWWLTAPRGQSRSEVPVTSNTFFCSIISMVTLTRGLPLNDVMMDVLRDPTVKSG